MSSAAAKNRSCRSSLPPATVANRLPVTCKAAAILAPRSSEYLPASARLRRQAICRQSYLERHVAVDRSRQLHSKLAGPVSGRHDPLEVHQLEQRRGPAAHRWCHLYGHRRWTVWSNRRSRACAHQYADRRDRRSTPIAQRWQATFHRQSHQEWRATLRARPDRAAL